MGASLASEIGGADVVDLLCTFIKSNGIRIIRRQLVELRERGIPFRVITTTCMGATVRRAIDQLVRDLGDQFKISYNSRSTPPPQVLAIHRSAFDASADAASLQLVRTISLCDIGRQHQKGRVPH